jgi:hypothetical protein
MTARCPSELALEAHLLDPERSGIAHHVAGCPRCAARLSQMRADGEDFALRVFPATVHAVEEAAGRRPWWRRPVFLVPIPALAALATLLLLVGPPGPPDDYVGVKGGAGGVGLTLFSHGPAGVAAVPDRGAVPSRAAIRFRVRTPSGCNLWIASIDGAGAVSRIYPSTGDGSAAVGAGERDLPGGAVLDGKPGPERVFAVCTPRPLPWTELEAALRGASALPASVSGPAPLAHLPAGAAWSSVLVEKRP